MPIEQTPTMTLAYDGSGALSASVDISTEGGNDVGAAPLPAPYNVAGVTGGAGLFAFQKRKAAAFMYGLPRPPASGALGGSPVMIIPVGGAGAALTPIPFTAELFEDDGLPGDITGEVVDAQAGRFAPIDVAGVYHIGLTFHGGDPTATAPNVPGPFVHAAIRVQAQSTGDPSALRAIGSVIRPSSVIFAGVSPAPTQTTGKYPFLQPCQLSTSSLWPLQRGSVVEVSVRQSQAVVAYGGAPAASPAKPWIFAAWLYMVQSF